MEVKTYNKTQIVAYVHRVEVISLEENLNVLRYTKDTVNSKTGAITYSATTEGFCSDKAITGFKSGKISWKTPKLYVMNKEAREKYREVGYNHKDAYEQILYENIFDLFANDVVTVEDVIELESGTHMIKDRFGAYIAGAVIGDYIESGIKDSNYDLKKVMEIFLARPDIKVFKAKRYDRSHPCEDFATTVEEGILSVPYYNSDSGYSEYIAFRWSPSDEDYKKAVAHASRKDTKTRKAITSPRSLFQSVWELDLLGIRIANYQEEWYGEPVKRPDFESWKKRRDHRDDDDY